MIILTTILTNSLDNHQPIIKIITALKKFSPKIPASLVAVLTTGGAAIVLGLKDSATGVVSGIIILFSKPFSKSILNKITSFLLLYVTGNPIKFSDAL